MNFAQLSNKPIVRVETRHFAPDARIIAEFPRMSYLSVNYDNGMPDKAYMHLQQCQTYDDNIILEIARKEHTEMELPGYFSDRTTLRHLIEIVRLSNHINTLTVHHVFSDYFHIFLESLGLREEAGKLIDLSDSNSPKTLFHIPCHNRYYLQYANIGYLYVQSNYEVHSVRIVNKVLTKYNVPSHHFS
ncbi:hypothetical protein PFISCL1PPCAC_13667, partial [Pristionchus fissidentatus]